MEAQKFMASNMIKESLHTFVTEVTKQKLQETARRERCHMGDIIDRLAGLHLRKDGVFI